VVFPPCSPHFSFDLISSNISSKTFIQILILEFLIANLLPLRKDHILKFLIFFVPRFEEYPVAIQTSIFQMRPPPPLFFTTNCLADDFLEHFNKCI